MRHLQESSLLDPFGTLIRWRSYGEGAPVLFANGFTTSDFFWSRLIPALSRSRRCITWDYPGHGASGPARDPRSTRVETLARDLSLVMDAARVSEAPLVGFSMGCQVVLEAWRHLPTRIQAIGVILGTSRHVLDTAFPLRIGALMREVMAHTGPRRFGLVMRGMNRVVHIPGAHPLARRLRISGPETPAPDLRAYQEHFLRMHAPTIRWMGLHANLHSAFDLLPTIHVPVLLVSGDRDIFTPPALAWDMASRLPNCRHVRLSGGTHTALWDHGPEILAELETLLARVG